MARSSITRAYQKIQELSWEPTFATPVKKYPTDYKFDKAPQKEPLKQVMQSYFPMQEEKDDRSMGAMDGALRGNMFRSTQPRWMEWMKLFLGISPFPEISAARAMPMLTSVVPNPELHNGLALQMIDEVRHSTIQMHLKRYYMKNYIDPAGFDTTCLWPCHPKRLLMVTTCCQLFSCRCSLTSHAISVTAMLPC
jgi:propane monooxygenase large subunit